VSFGDEAWWDHSQLGRGSEDENPAAVGDRADYETHSQSVSLNKLSSSPPQWALLILAPLC